MVTAVEAVAEVLGDFWFLFSTTSTTHIKHLFFAQDKYKIRNKTPTHTHTFVFRCVLVPPLCFQGKSWEEVNHFTSTETFPIIVKPVESAGSDGVKLCYNLEEAHFGGARVISSDDFEGKTFLKHISSEIPSLKGGGAFARIAT